MMQRMPNPLDLFKEESAKERRDVRRMGALLLAELRMQTVLLQRLVELGEQNKASLDAMQEKDPFSVRGLGDADDGGPFIGG